MPARKITVLKGLFFDPATWDGSDFFMPAADRGWQFVTDDVRRAFKRAKVKNLEFTAAAEREHGRVEPGA